MEENNKNKELNKMGEIPEYMKSGIEIVLENHFLRLSPPTKKVIVEGKNKYIYDENEKRPCNLLVMKNQKVVDNWTLREVLQFVQLLKDPETGKWIKSWFKREKKKKEQEDSNLL